MRNKQMGIIYRFMLNCIPLCTKDGGLCNVRSILHVSQTKEALAHLHLYIAPVHIVQCTCLLCYLLLL